MDLSWWQKVYKLSGSNYTGEYETAANESVAGFVGY